MDNFVCVRHQKIKISTQLKFAEMEHNRDGRFATRENIIQSKTKNNIYFSNIKLDWRKDVLKLAFLCLFFMPKYRYKE